MPLSIKSRRAMLLAVMFVLVVVPLILLHSFLGQWQQGLVLFNRNSRVNGSSTALVIHNAPSTTASRTNKSATTVVVHWGGLESTNSFGNFIQQYWQTNVFCQTIQQHYNHNNNTQASTPQIILKIDLKSCEEFQDNIELGTGNLLTAIYGIRLAALRHSVELHIQCNQDAWKMQGESILPWVLGRFPATNSVVVDNNHPTDIDTIEAYCSTFNHVPIGEMAHDIQFELRRMAVSLVALPTDHPANDWIHYHNLRKTNSHYQYQLSLPPDNKHEKPYSVVFPTHIQKKVELDDTTIHFRAGDLLSFGLKGYGFMKFSAYRNLITKFNFQPRSIGIVTQAFNGNESNNNNNNNNNNKHHPKSAARLLDAKNGKRGRILVTALADYLQEAFPATTVRIHQGESMPLSFARMILANQTIGAFSSFAVFPAMATFGRGFLRHPRGTGPYRWIVRATSSKNSPRMSRVQLFEEPDIIPAAVLNYVWNHLGEDVLLAWFRNDIDTEELQRLAMLHEENQNNVTSSEGTKLA